MAGLPERARPQAIKRLTVKLVPHRSESETIDQSLGARCLLRLHGNRRAAEQRDELAATVDPERPIREAEVDPPNLDYRASLFVRDGS